MPDDRSKRGGADRKRVSVVEEHEVRYWCDRFDCTERQLRDAVEDVGPMVVDVEAWLDNQRG
jgi:hypothetical protein